MKLANAILVCAAVYAGRAFAEDSVLVIDSEQGGFARVDAAGRVKHRWRGPNTINAAIHYNKDTVLYLDGCDDGTLWCLYAVTLAPEAGEIGKRTTVASWGGASCDDAGASHVWAFGRTDALVSILLSSQPPDHSDGFAQTIDIDVAAGTVELSHNPKECRDQTTVKLGTVVSTTKLEPPTALVAPKQRLRPWPFLFENERVVRRAKPERAVRELNGVTFARGETDSVSDDGRFVLVSNEEEDELQLFDGKTGKLSPIALTWRSEVKVHVAGKKWRQQPNYKQSVPAEAGVQARWMTLDNTSVLYVASHLVHPLGKSHQLPGPLVRFPSKPAP